jgi:hypothetical protein
MRARGFCLCLVTFLVLSLVGTGIPGCGGGWDAYEPFYENTPSGNPGEPWVGPEKVLVELGAERVETALEGIETSGFHTTSGLTIAAVRISDLIDRSGITPSPENDRFDFTATDGYNLLRKRGGDLSLMPDWENLHHGYLYSSDIGDLTVGWDEAEQPWGSAVSAYNVKYMDGGVIGLLEP